MKDQDLEKKYRELMEEVERLRKVNDANEEEKARKAKEAEIAKVHALYSRLDVKAAVAFAKAHGYKADKDKLRRKIERRGFDPTLLDVPRKRIVFDDDED